MNRMIAILLCLGCSLCSGCMDKLNFEKSFTLPESGGMDYKKFELPAQTREQTIKVDFTSSAEPMDLFVFVDKKEGVDELTNEKRAGQSAASLRNSAKGTLTVKIPAKTPPVILIAMSKTSSKKSEVVLKMTN